MKRDLSVNILAPSEKFEAGTKRMEASARSLHASELRLIAAEERLEKLRTTGKATAGQLASAQASVITAQDNVAKAHGRAAEGAEVGQRRTSKAFDAVSKSASSMRTGVGVAAAAGGTAVLAFANQVTDAASSLNEQMSATKVIFKSAADEVLAFADSAEALGVSKRAALEASNGFGDLFTKLGYTHDAAATFSEDLVRISADFSSFKNMSPEEVLEKLRSGLAGESEPLRALGVFLTEAKVKAEGMKLGLADAHGELDDGAKVAARYSLIMQNMGEAQGDAARTSDSYANTQRRAAASAENLQATIGQQLLPIMGDAAFVFGEVAGALVGTTKATDDAAAGLDWLERSLGRTEKHSVYGKSGFELLAGVIRHFKGDSEDAAEAGEYLADSQAKVADAESRARQEVQLSVQEVEKQQAALESASPTVRAYAEELGLGSDSIKGMTEQLEGWGEQLGSAIDPLGAYTGKLEEKDAAERAAAEVTAESTKDASDSWEDYFTKQSVGYAEYKTELEGQVKAQQDWSTNMLQLAGRVSEGTLEELFKLGPEGAPLIADFVKRSDAELAQLEPLFAARSKAATDAQATEFKRWNVLAPQLTAKIGKDAVAGLARELQAGTTTVADISRRYAFELAGGITPLLRAVGKDGVTLTDVKRDVAMVQRYAKGGSVGAKAYALATGGPQPALELPAIDPTRVCAA